MAINQLCYGGGWFSDRLTSTGSSSASCKAVDVAAPISVVYIGTGACIDDLNWWRQHRLNEAAANSSMARVVEITWTRSPVEDLERIRKILSPAIADLANALNVSRQAIYNWLNGEQPKSEHIAKLRDLAQAADVIADAGISVSGALLKRKIIDDKNLFEVSASGKSALDTAQLLVRVIRREIGQREQMAARFAGRRGSSRSVESDFPSENDAD